MLLLGHGALLALYALLFIRAASAEYVVLAVFLLGVYYAATDGVLMAVCGGILPASLRGTGFALLTTATSLCRLAASVAFGWIWTTWNARVAIIVFAAALACSVPAAALMLGRPMNAHE
jgi:hypothetical protein